MRRVYPITRNPKELLTGRYLFFPEFAIEVLNPDWFKEEDGTYVKLNKDEYIVGDLLLDCPGIYYAGTYEEIKELGKKNNEIIKKLKNNNL